MFNKIPSFAQVLTRLVLAALVLVCGAIPVLSQQADGVDEHARISKARALAASHSLPAAATELTGILSSTRDDAIRDIARILLMDVFLEQADYTSAQSLLEQTYNSRSAKDEASTRNYFALAGQAVNGAREHIARYRSFGINVSDRDLPGDAINDLNRLRLLLDRVGEQAKTLSTGNDKATDATALLEDVATVRTVLARDPGEREQWQQEFEAARRRLASNETRLASLTARSSSGAGTTPAAGNGMPTQSIAASQVTSQPTHAQSPAPEVVPASQTSSAPTTSNGLINMGSLADKVVRQVKPSFPSVAKSANVSGEVTVYLQIDEKGSVAKVERSTGPKLLQGAAEAAARQWKFTPMEINGLPSKYAGFVVFRFTTN